MKVSIRAAANGLTVALLCFATRSAFAHPCSGVDRSLSEAQKVSLAPALEIHMRTKFDTRVAGLIAVRPNDVLGMFRAGGWYIVHTDNHATDDPYLFYSTDPTKTSGYVGVWAGGAAADEGPSIQTWAKKEMPRIPHALARCFAWYVTYGVGHQ
jgi:hypothetical protein